MVAELLSAKNEPRAAAAELSHRCLGRAPTAAETERIAKKLKGTPDPRAVLEDLVRALLNADEFLFDR